MRLSELYDHPLIRSAGGIVRYDALPQSALLADGTWVTLEKLFLTTSGRTRITLETVLLTFETARQRWAKNDTPGTWDALHTGDDHDARLYHPLFENWRRGRARKQFGTFDVAKVDSPTYVGGNVNYSTTWVSETKPKPWTSEDALTLILEEIRHSDDPMVTGGQWLMRFTNQVSAIIREADDES